jgi:trigger factor
VRWALLQEAVAEREELAATDADVEVEIARLAREAGQAPQAVRAALERGGDLEHLRLSLREAKVLKLLIDNAEILSAA